MANRKHAQVVEVEEEELEETTGNAGDGEETAPAKTKQYRSEVLLSSVQQLPVTYDAMVEAIEAGSIEEGFALAKELASHAGRIRRIIRLMVKSTNNGTEPGAALHNLLVPADEVEDTGDEG